jgi:hypothetical protein
MASQQTLSVAKRAKELYDARLRKDLEPTHIDQFVAIEPESGEYFIGRTYSESVSAARNAYPDRISFVIRVGHEAAIHLGAVSN